jgi:hypothetical protein
MRLKLDENLGRMLVRLFQEAGHDVATVSGQHLNGVVDKDLIEFCRQEQRCLVSLDLDFSNPLVFKPSLYRGIAVLRLPRKPSYSDLIDGARTLILGLQTREIAGKLWVIQRGRIREHQEEGLEPEWS